MYSSSFYRHPYYCELLKWRSTVLHGSLLREIHLTYEVTRKREGKNIVINVGCFCVFDNNSEEQNLFTNPDCQLKMYPSFSSQYKLMISPMHRKSLIVPIDASRSLYYDVTATVGPQVGRLRSVVHWTERTQQKLRKNTSSLKQRIQRSRNKSRI